MLLAVGEQLVEVRVTAQLQVRQRGRFATHLVVGAMTSAEPEITVLPTWLVQLQSSETRFFPGSYATVTVTVITSPRQTGRWNFSCWLR